MVYKRVLYSHYNSSKCVILKYADVEIMRNWVMISFSQPVCVLKVVLLTTVLYTHYFFLCSICTLNMGWSSSFVTLKVHQIDEFNIKKHNIFLQGEHAPELP